jgi:WD40 repeat protein
VAFAPSGLALVSAGLFQSSGGNGQVGGVEIWNLPSGTLSKYVATTSGDLYSVGVSNDSKTIAVGGSVTSAQGSPTGYLSLLNAATGAQIASLSTTASVITSIAFSPTGLAFADAGQVGTQAGNGLHGLVEARNLPGGATAWTLNTGANQSIASLSFSSDKKTLAFGGVSIDPNSQARSRVMSMCQAATGTGIVSVTSAPGSIGAVAFAPNGKSIAGGGDALDIWTVATLALAVNFDAQNNMAALSIAQSPDGSMLATAGGNASGDLVEIRSPATGALIRTLMAGDKFTAGVAFSPDSKTLATEGDSATGDVVLRLWNPKTGVLNRTVDLGTLLGRSQFYALQFTSDGKQIITDGPGATGTGGQAIQEIEAITVATGSVAWTLKTDMVNVMSICQLPGGTSMAVAGLQASGGSYTAVVEIIDVTTGHVYHTFNTGAAYLYSLATSIDGTMMAAAGYDYDPNTQTLTPSISFWNVRTGSLLSTQHPAGTSAYSVAFNDDGKYLFAGTNNLLLVYSTANFGVTKEFDQEAEGGVSTIALSPDGATLLYSRDDGVVVSAKNTYYTLPVVYALTVARQSVKGGTKTTGQVYLSAPAPIGGATVTLNSGSSAVSVPVSVKVPMGAMSVMFNISTTAVTTSTSVQITASYNSTSANTTLTVTP